MLKPQASEYSSLVASLFGTCKGERGKKKAAYGILYSKATVHRSARIAKTIIKVVEITANILELLATIEALESAIGWGEGQLAICSRKKYLTDGIKKYCQIPARDGKARQNDRHKDEGSWNKGCKRPPKKEK